jgi:hypothetical protein
MTPTSHELEPPTIPGRFTATGIGVVGVSGIAAVFAPEALPAEFEGVEFGVGLVTVGGTVSSLGASLQGYARAGGGARGVFDGTVLFGLSYLKDQQMEKLTGLTGVGETENKFVSSVLGDLLDKAVEAVHKEAEACGS